MKIFLSYAREDKYRALELYRKLKEDGFDAWIDSEKLVAGQDWDFEISKAIKASDAIILCLTTRSVRKTGYVQREMRKAIDLAQNQPEGEIYVIPAKLDECEPPESVSRWQYVDLFSETGYDKLRKALEVKAEHLSGNIATSIAESSKQHPRKDKLMKLLSVARQLYEQAYLALQENQDALTPAIQGLETTEQGVEKMIGIFHRQKSRGYFTKHEAYLHAIIQKDDSGDSTLQKITEELHEIVGQLIEIFYSNAEESNGRLISKSNILRKEMLLNTSSIENLSFFGNYLEGIRLRVERISRIIGKLSAMNE